MISGEITWPSLLGNPVDDPVDGHLSDQVVLRVAGEVFKFQDGDFIVGFQGWEVHRTDKIRIDDKQGDPQAYQADERQEEKVDLLESAPPKFSGNRFALRIRYGLSLDGIGQFVFPDSEYV